MCSLAFSKVARLGIQNLVRLHPPAAMTSGSDQAKALEQLEGWVFDELKLVRLPADFCSFLLFHSCFLVENRGVW